VRVAPLDDCLDADTVKFLRLRLIGCGRYAFQMRVLGCSQRAVVADDFKPGCGEHTDLAALHLDRLPHSDVAGVAE
jgi:hypothetical protein